MFYIGKVKNKIPRGGFVYNVLTLMTGTTIAQAIPIGISPILTRIYSPEDFGLFALYMSIASMISVVATARYELAIMLPEKEEDAVNIVALAVLIAFFMSMAALVLIFIFNDNITNLLKNSAISMWLYFIPLTVFLTGLYQSFNYWSNRKLQYKRLAISRVTQSTATAGANLGIGFTGFKTGGLIGGGILGQAMAVAVLGWQIWRDDREQTKHISKEKIIAQAKAYSDFPKKSSFGALFNILSNQVPVILLASFYSPVIVGFYSLTLRVLNAPMSLIGSSISQVFYEKATKASRDGNLYPLVQKMTRNLFFIIILPMTALFIFGESLFSFVFGESWAEAGKIAQIMAPFFLIRFIFSNQSTMLMILRRMDFEIKLNLYFFLSQVASLALGYYVFRSHSYSFIFMSLSGVLVFLYLGYFIRTMSRSK